MTELTKEQTYTATEKVNLLTFAQELHEALDTESVTVVTKGGLAEEASEESPWEFEVVSDKNQPTIVKKVLKAHEADKVESDPEWDEVAKKLGDGRTKLSADELKLAVSKIAEKLG